MKRFIAVLAVLLLFTGAVFGYFAAFPRPYREEVEGSGLDHALVYAVMKAESGFREDAVSRAGAVGLMQLLPATAYFAAELAGIPFEAARLKEGAYNIKLGCAYLKYLLEQFEEETALAAYNAGEGTVRGWLLDGRYSTDGRTLERVPYAETARYLKKISLFRKIYGFFPY